MSECFALLDDRGATAERPTSRLYTGFVREHVCADPTALDRVWAEVDADLRAGLHAVLLADYEWGARLLHAGDARLAAADGGALRVLMFSTLQPMSRGDADAWLALREGSEAPGAAGIQQLQPSVDRAAFGEAIARIHAAIGAGETYQVNYTYRLDGQAHGSPLALFRRLRQRQPVSYGALIALPALDDGGVPHVLSCSPELFLRHDAGVVTAKPMKGTASRIAGAEADSETARHLSIDIKNRAENLMIVDLLRNDLGRIAETGSVSVPQLFDIEPYATVFQMTSTVQARVRAEVDMPALLRATFPCGSITGAPKHYTMGLIAGLESTPRGLYCGAIGWVDAPAGTATLGNFCLSVAIRTLTLGAPREGGLMPVRLGVGAGIVQDSVAADEFDECRLKARFATRLDPGFALFETLLASREGGARHLERHLARLAGSAATLGFAFDGEAARDAVLRAADSLAPNGVSRLRLQLAHDGGIGLTAAPLAPLNDGPVRLLVAPEPLEPSPLSMHKTTLRERYDAGVRAAEAAGAFDSLFFQADGRLVEGGRSNVFLRLDGRWWTPPLADGALPGVMRALLLDDANWGAGERTLRHDDLLRADAVVVCNALRGALPARL